MKCNKKGLAIMVVLFSEKASVTNITFHLEFQYQRLKCTRLFISEKRDNYSNTTNQNKKTVYDVLITFRFISLHLQRKRHIYQTFTFTNLELQIGSISISCNAKRMTVSPQLLF